VRAHPNPFAQSHERLDDAVGALLSATAAAGVMRPEVEADDVVVSLALVDKPRRAGTTKRAAGTANPVTGRRSPGGGMRRRRWHTARGAPKFLGVPS